MIDLIARRREMMGASEPPYLDGWEYYKKLETNGTLSNSAATMVSPFIDKGAASASITYTKGFRLCYYDESQQSVDYWGMNGTTTRTAGANVRYIRVCFYIADIDDSYVYDNTNAKYLFKGKNI